MAALVEVKDLWFTASSLRHLQGIEAELRVKAAGKLSAVGAAFSAGEHGPGQQIHDRQQVEESFLQRDVGDISGPDLVHCRDLFEIHQAGVAL